MLVEKKGIVISYFKLRNPQAMTNLLFGMNCYLKELSQMNILGIAL